MTVTEPPHDGECTDQSHSSNQKVVSSTDPIPQYHPYQSHTSVCPLDTWFVPLSGCTGRCSLTRGHQALSCECTHIPPRWLCLIELSSYPCRGPLRRVTLTRHFKSVLTRQLQLQMVLSSPTRYCHCCSRPCRISNSAVRSATSSHACDLPLNWSYHSLKGIGTEEDIPANVGATSPDMTSPDVPRQGSQEPLLHLQVCSSLVW